MQTPLRRRAILRLGGAVSGLALASAAGLTRLAPRPAAAESFTLNGFTVAEPFATYWRQNGGLAQQGMPISGRFAERSPFDGMTYEVQYFERAVFELHPEYVGSANEVLLQLLGQERYAARYPQGAPGQEPNASAGSVTFPETGKRLGGRFLQYWQANGGLRQQGYPISDEFTEVSGVDGKPYRVQYFERAVFELHPENQPPYDVLLSLLGSTLLIARYPNGTPVSSLPPTPSPEPLPTGCESRLPIERTDSRRTGVHTLDGRPFGQPFDDRNLGSMASFSAYDKDFPNTLSINTRVVSIDRASRTITLNVGKDKPLVVHYEEVDRFRIYARELRHNVDPVYNDAYYRGATLCDLLPEDLLKVVFPFGAEEELERTIQSSGIFGILGLQGHQ